MMIRRCGLIPLVLTLLCLLAGACERRSKTVTKGIYYWKTGFEQSAFEQQRLREIGLQKMYIRLFDVDWDEQRRQPVPTGTIRWKEQPGISCKVVPVVFITQRTLVLLQPGQLPELATNINRLLSGLCAQAGIAPSEIQIDCDWTAATRQVYFRLLDALRQQSFFKDKILSCTIRLHQVKYVARNGVPPVDRGLLMCYNMGNTRKPGPHNSILDGEEARDYLGGIGHYSLPLDLALPLYTQCILFRNNSFQGIMRDVYPEQVSSNALFDHDKDNLYRVRADSNWRGFHLRRGDIIRIEQVRIPEIREMSNFVLKHLHNDTLSVVLFDSDSITLSKYPAYDLETVYHPGF